MIAAHARTLRESIEFYLETKIPDKHPILAWLVDYCGSLITLFSKGSFKDGLTPIQRMKGKPWRTGVPPFLEKVEYKRRSKNNFDGRWRSGCYLGVDRRTSERISGDPEGTYVVQSVRRVPFEDRWDAPFALSIVGVPWLPNLKGADPKELAEAILIEPECPDVKAEAPDVATHYMAPVSY